jgi:hypothetical protein
METAGVLSILLIVFAAIVFLFIRLIWIRYRLIAVIVPQTGDIQAAGYKLVEAIRSLGFREGSHPGPARVYRAPAWMKWAVGLQDISVAPAGSEAVLVTGPGFWVSSVGRRFPGATRRPYDGHQPVWPLFKGCMRLAGMLLLLTVTSCVAAYVFTVR